MGSIPILISEMKSYDCFLSSNVNFPRSAAFTFWVKAKIFLWVWGVLDKKITAGEVKERNICG